MRERNIKDPPNDEHGSQGSRESHLDPRQPLQEGSRPAKGRRQPRSSAITKTAAASLRMETKAQAQDGGERWTWWKRCQRCEYLSCLGIIILRLAFLLGTIIWLFSTSSSVRHAHHRSADSGQGLNDIIPHGYALNEWWQMVNFSAHASNITNCYACTHMPSSVGTPGIWPYNMTMKKATCIIGLTTHPGSKPISQGNFSAPLNLTWLKSHLLGLDCTAQVDLLA